MHNRIGTFIRDNEKNYIKKNEVKPFMKGQLVIYEKEYETYQILLYVKNEDQHNCECITHDEKNYKLLSIKKDMLYHYSQTEMIRQDVLPGQPAVSLDYIIETYIM